MPLGFALHWLTFVVKAVDAIDTRALVVASEDEEVFGILDLMGGEPDIFSSLRLSRRCEDGPDTDLVRKQQADGLERLLPSVDIVAEEEVVGFGWEPAVFEQTEEVVILSVDVACTCGRDTARRELEPENLTRGAGTLGRADAPQIFIGASSSSRMGWLMKISLAFVHRNRISASPSWTCFPGRFPRTFASRGSRD